MRVRIPPPHVLRPLLISACACALGLLAASASAYLLFAALTGLQFAAGLVAVWRNWR